MAMIGELIGAVANFVPPWVLAIVAVVVVALMAPGWITGLRVKKVKALLRKTVRAEGDARKALQQQALDVASGRGEVLLALVREADKLNQPGLRDTALKQLAKLGTHADEVRKLAAPPDPKRDRQFGHPVEAVVFIERLLDSGATEAARERLDQALSRFPDDAGLRDLESRLAAPVESP